MLIYNYEAKILEFINSCFPDIKEATYSNDQDILTAIDNIKYYPSFYYSRDVQEWSYNKVLSVFDNGTKYDFIPFTQTYHGFILLEDVKDLMTFSSKLRFYWSNHTTVSVPWSTDDPLTVQLRLLYIKLSDSRRPNDKKGACRILEFSWKSNLFIDSVLLNQPLTESVKIFLDSDNRGVVVGKDSSGNDIILNTIIKEI